MQKLNFFFLKVGEKKFDNVLLPYCIIPIFHYTKFQYTKNFDTIMIMNFGVPKFWYNTWYKGFGTVIVPKLIENLVHKQVYILINYIMSNLVHLMDIDFAMGRDPILVILELMGNYLK